MPERFAEWERQEQGIREHLDKEVSILKRTTNGEKQTLTLTQLRQEIGSQPSLIDDSDLGGCGCFVDFDEVENGL
jgi:hypothetical protein